MVMKFMPKNHFSRKIYLSATLLMGVIITGCAPVQTKQAAPETIKLTCDMPELTPLKETKDYLPHGNIAISVAPIAYKCVPGQETETKQITPTLSESLSGSLSGEDKRKVFVEQVTTPNLHVEPDKVSFLLKINNKLPHVFRGDGSIVAIKVSGQLIQVPQQNYSQLTGAIIPPREEQDITIGGPPVSNLKDGAMVALLIEDVVTETNAAGDPTKREHYQWFFKVSRKHKEIMAQVERKRGWMNPAVLYQQQESDQMKQQMQIMQQMQRQLQQQ